MTERHRRREDHPFAPPRTQRERLARLGDQVHRRNRPWARQRGPGRQRRGHRGALANRDGRSGESRRIPIRQRTASPLRRPRSSTPGAGRSASRGSEVTPRAGSGVAILGSRVAPNRATASPGRRRHQAAAPTLGVDAAGCLHGRGGAASARRHPDHGRAAVGRPRPRRQGQLDLGRPERLLRRLRARPAARRRARGPLRSAQARARRAGAVRRRCPRGRAGFELRAADRGARRPGRRRRPRQPGRTRGRGQRLSARAPRQRARHLGRERRDVEPARAAARWSADGRIRLARVLVGAGAARRARGARDRAADAGDRQRRAQGPTSRS